jgi:hypothetical protein
MADVMSRLRPASIVSGSGLPERMTSFDEGALALADLSLHGPSLPDRSRTTPSALQSDRRGWGRGASTSSLGPDCALSANTNASDPSNARTYTRRTVNEPADELVAELNSSSRRTK